MRRIEDRIWLMRLPAGLAVVCTLLFACQKETGTPAPEVTIHLGIGVEDYTGQVATRALTEGFHAFGEGDDNVDEAVTKPSVRLYMTKADGTVKDGIFSHSNNYSWTSSMSVEPDIYYYVYGYMPSSAAYPSIAPNGDDYSTGATLTLNNLKTACADDVCVVVGVAKEEQKNFFDIRDPFTPISIGSYSYRPSGSDNFMYVLMDHIYTKMSIIFKVKGDDDYYYSLRGIKLKKVEMITNVGTVTVTVSSTGTPVTSYSAESGVSEETVQIFSSDDGVEITPSGLSIPAFFTPMNPNTEKTVTVKSVYDVYYRDHLTNALTTPVRENCTATNKLILRSTPAKPLSAGVKATFTATVEPTYLYVLGDPDLDNPTIKLE